MTQAFRALLLAAGLGTRLRPITLDTPKCLVTIGGEPLLGRWLKQLELAGCEAVLINTHYLAEKVQAFLTSTTTPLKVGRKNKWKEKEMEPSSTSKLSTEELSQRVQSRLQELESIIADDPGDLSAYRAEHTYASTISVNIVKLVRFSFFLSLIV